MKNSSREEKDQSFKACEICNANDWKNIYQGRIRDGAYGVLTPHSAIIGKCNHCGVERLAEKDCKKESVYEGGEYRALLHESTDSADFFAEHDVLQLERLNVFPPHNLRGKVIADVGCAAGSFADHISGLAAEVICIEPCKLYHDDLLSRGYKVYQYAKGAFAEQRNRIDIAFAFSVIEHVHDPKVFLEDISQILKPCGKLIISTPNREDILMRLLPDTYPNFFYRTVHRWYFDSESIRFCSQAAGFDVADVKCVHRFGIANLLVWLRDRHPVGRKTIDDFNSQSFDNFYKSYLEEKGTGDYLYLILEKKG